MTIRDEMNNHISNKVHCSSSTTTKLPCLFCGHTIDKKEDSIGYILDTSDFIHSGLIMTCTDTECYRYGKPYDYDLTKMRLQKWPE